MHYGGASMPTPPEKKDRQPTSSPDDLEGDAALAGDGTLRTPSRLAKIYNQYTYTPERCRYRPESPSKLTTWLNVLFGKKVQRYPFNKNQMINSRQPLRGASQ